MSKDGPGGTNTNGLSWFRAKDFSKAETDYDANDLVWRNRLKLAMAKYPHLRPQAAELVRRGYDVLDILRHFELANKFRDDISPNRHQS
jgi:hypothetical protein